MYGARRLNDVQSRRPMQSVRPRKILVVGNASARGKTQHISTSPRLRKFIARLQAGAPKWPPYTTIRNEAAYESIWQMLQRTNRCSERNAIEDVQDGGKDATDAMEKGDFNRAKALFRRAQGRSFLGDWVEAKEDYTEALALQPRERNIVDGFEELKRLRNSPVDKQAACISEQAKLALLDPFEGEVKRKDASKRCWVTACHSHRWKVDVIA
ncbi:hypothetical protein C8F04DRAFT_1197934 [Mycena alexandri]|uniref:Uncharacterized protein n=1 Tax=Mycena alexandri TaxID=1745969 RepID=A0AAD6S2S7_9AGAR|nr:hypothetical protein C8F04DRAFT_1197934 [Mycena alexandri]